MSIGSKLVSLVAVAALIASTASAAGRGGGGSTSDIVGGIIGGAVTGIILNEAAKKRARTRVVRRAPSPARAHNREIQEALNYFGFPAGTVDGVLGRKSRAAISAYQVYLGMPATGKLTEIEDQILLTSYALATSGAPEIASLIATAPAGARALLLQQRDSLLGIESDEEEVVESYAGLPVEVGQAVEEIVAGGGAPAEQLLQRAGFLQLADLNGDGANDYILDTGKSGSTFWCDGPKCKVIVFVSTPQGHARNDFFAPDPTPASFSCKGPACELLSPAISADGGSGDSGAAEGDGGGLAVFEEPLAEASLAQGCASLGPRGQAPAGAKQSAQNSLMTHFCEARANAITDGSDLASGLFGVSAGEIAARCEQYAVAVAPYLEAIASEPSKPFIGEVGGYIASFEVNRGELSRAAKICLAFGYEHERLDIAMASLILLTGLGDEPYGELIGHHLALGHGVPARPDLAAGWYKTAFAGSPDAEPEEVERAHSIRMALTALQSPLSDFSALPALKPVEGGALSK